MPVGNATESLDQQIKTFLLRQAADRDESQIGLGIIIGWNAGWHFDGIGDDATLAADGNRDMVERSLRLRDDGIGAPEQEGACKVPQGVRLLSRRIISFARDHFQLRTDGGCQHLYIDLRQKAQHGGGTLVEKDPAQAHDPPGQGPATADGRASRVAEPKQPDAFVERVVDPVARSVEGADRDIPASLRPVRGEQADDPLRAPCAQCLDDEADAPGARAR